jgi:YHS domain-containing protein
LKAKKIKEKKMEKKQKDPVCGMSVDPSQSSYKIDYQQKKYAFCCKDCMDKFKKNPQEFASK